MSKKIFAMLLTATLLFSVVSISFSANALIDTSINYGDVDGDGDVDTDDCRIALAAAAGIESIKDPERKIRADINSDGEITIFDARQILRDASSLIELQVSGAFQGFDPLESYHDTPEELINEFNTALNRIKTEKAGFQRTQAVTDITFDLLKAGNLGEAGTNLMKETIRTALTTAGEPEVFPAAIKGENNDNQMSAETKDYVSRLTEDNILGAKSSYDFETGLLTIEVALADCEIDNLGQTAFNDVFNPSVIQENAESVVVEVFDTSKLSDAKRRMIRDCVLKVVIDKSTGNVTEYVTTYKTDIYLAESDFRLTKLYGVQYGTRVTDTYNDFQW